VVQGERVWEGFEEAVVLRPCLYFMVIGVKGVSMAAKSWVLCIPRLHKRYSFRRPLSRIMLHYRLDYIIYEI
jgi:hypothetical protein